MAKYSYEFKNMIVDEYLQGREGYGGIGKKYGIDKSIVKQWVANYKHFGEEGLMRSIHHQVYTFEYKLHVVELYLTSEMSYRELALQEGITNPAMITNWVTNYRAAGPEALKPRRKGGKRKMEKKKVIRRIKEGDSEEQKELLKQLQEENLRLRIENAFLKEVRRLRLEEEALLKKQRESSTASEENLN